MSPALTAMALVYIHARSGEWVRLDAIAFHLGVKAHQVRQVLEPEVNVGRVHYATHEGHPCFGIRVEGIAPATQPATLH